MAMTDTTHSDMQSILGSKRVPGRATTVGIASRKGGPGKSTVASILTHGLALRGLRVRALEIEDNVRLYRLFTGAGSILTSEDEGEEEEIDDNQTTYMLLTQPNVVSTHLPYVIDEPALTRRIPSLSLEARNELLRTRGWQHPQPFDFMPGSPRIKRLDDRLAGALHDTVRAIDPYLQLTTALGHLVDDCDVVVMDTPPNCSTVQYNAFMACDYIIIVVDFDPDSIHDYRNTMSFYVDAVTACRTMHRPEPKLLGVVYNKFDSKFTDNDVQLLSMYTKPHLRTEQDAKLHAPLITQPTLGVIPDDRERLVRAMHNRMSIHTYAPTSEIGEAAYAFCCEVEQRIGVANYTDQAMHIRACETVRKDGQVR
jgi:cellulose biosynthesis protein BcsQ